MDYVVMRTKTVRARGVSLNVGGTKYIITCEWELRACRPGRSSIMRRRKDGYNPVVLARARQRICPGWMKFVLTFLDGLSLDEARAYLRRIGR